MIFLCSVQVDVESSSASGCSSVFADDYSMSCENRMLEQEVDIAHAQENRMLEQGGDIAHAEENRMLEQEEDREPCDYLQILPDEDAVYAGSGLLEDRKLGPEDDTAHAQNALLEDRNLGPEDDTVYAQNAFLENRKWDPKTTLTQTKEYREGKKFKLLYNPMCQVSHPQ